MLTQTMLTTIRSRLLPPTIASVIFLVVWHVSVIIFAIPSFILPSPAEVLHALLSRPEILFNELLYTLFTLTLGFAVAFITSFVCAFLFHLSGTFEKAIYPFLVALKIAPVIAVAPFLVLWFGLGLTSHIIIVALISFFPILVTMAQGFKQRHVYYDDYFALQKASPISTFLKLRLPISLPYIFAGAKTSVVLAMSGVFVAEFITGTRGIGNEIATATRFFRSDDAFAALFVAIVGGIAFYVLVAFIQKRVVFWDSIDSK